MSTPPPSTFFRTSTLWVVNYLYDGRPRRWYRCAPEGADPGPALREELQQLYGERARLVKLSPATAEEERAYVRGEAEPNAYCPTVRPPRPSPL